MNKKNPKKYAVLVYELVVNLTAFFFVYEIDSQESEYRHLCESER